MSNSKTNMIRFGGRVVNLDHIKSDKDLNEIVDVTLSVLASALVLGSSAIKDENKRMEFIMSKAGKLAAEAVKKAIFVIANTPKEGKDTDA